MNVSTYMCLSDQSLVQSIQEYKKKKNIFKLINYQLQLFQIEIHEGFPTKKTWFTLDVKCTCFL